MKFYVLTIVGFMVGTISYFHNNLEYKNVNAPHSCYGECYEEYVNTYGTVVEQLLEQQEAAASDEFSSIRGLWAGCAACHGQEGQGMGVFPALAGQSKEYIVDRLYAYQNREEVGSMSSTMWAQAGLLSDNDIDTIGAFVKAGLPK
jgi:cytochrome c553